MRAFLGGGGEPPREEFALIGVGESTGVPLILLLEDGEVFTPADYISLGYTNFEAWCVGAMGGHGGRVPSWLRNYPSYSGGAGGGGGVHRVGGLLADLPSTVLAEVGQAGANGAEGSRNAPKNAVLGSDGYPVTPLVLVDNASYVAPGPGGDGGPSSFGDICKASGGKGGAGVHQGPWHRVAFGPDDYEFYRLSWTLRAIPGTGGEGGAGDSLVAGGGAPGGLSGWSGVAVDNTGGSRYFTKPGDGTWDGAVGLGGGGGVGEILSWTEPTGGGTISPFIDSHYQVAMARAAIGGKGAFSFADTSVYGPGASYTYDPTHDGEPLPGSGGGARVPGNRKYGSEAMGYSHDGVVLLRLTRVD